MKRIIVCMVVLVSALTSFAQTKDITVTGTVIESDSREAAVQATVQLLSLPDSTYITGAATLTGGKFTLPKVSAGKYVLKISYIGFHTKYVPIQLSPNKLNNDLGAITLESDAVLLSEAVITAEAPPVKMVEDTTVYAASAYRVAEGAMLEELVKKLPGAEVSEDGKITINGKEVKKIMVDGKEFFSDDPKVSMKNLPVNMVENVKSYDRKSDMARITGIDDGDEETVLDLTVKKGMKQGWIGNVIAGYGSEERYEGGVMVSRFKDDASVSILGSVNNTNGTGFSEFGDAGQGMSSGRGAGSGITSSESLGVNFAKDTKKLQYGGNIQYGHTDNDAKRKSSSEEYLGDDGMAYENSENSSRRKRHDVRADFRFEWRPDSMTTIIFRPNVSYSQTKSSSNSWSEEFNNEGGTIMPINKKDAYSFNKSENYSLNGRLQLFRKLNSKGRNLFIGGNFGYSNGETEGDSFSDMEFFKNDSTSTTDLHTSRNNDNRNWSVSASYTEPVFKNHFLQLRYEFSHQKRLGESLVYDNLLTDYKLYPNSYTDSLSSRVENFYDNHTIDLSIRGVHPKMMYHAGVALTPQSSRSETSIGPNTSEIPKKQNVLNFSPQIMFRYMFSKQHTLMFRYRGRSSAPSIENLQQVIDQTDPLNIQYGNPNLKPSFSHNIMLFYNKYIPQSMRSYAFNLFYTNTQNSVANRMTYNEATGGRIYEKVNINGNWNTRGFFSFNTPLKNKKFTISSNTNANFSNAVSYTTLKRTEDAVLSTTRSLRAGERLTGSYRSDLFDVSLITSINYNLTRNNKQSNSNRETFDYNFGGSTNFNLPKQFYLSTDINYRIMKGYGDGFRSNEVIWNAQISKNFLKNNAGTIRLKIYDILQEQSNLSRTITETRITDTEYNTLGSYFMVHFVYRFNTLGGKAPSRSGFGRGPGGHGGRGPGGPPPGGRF
ncbi:TonB-dependent receptor [Bacteroides sp. 519]|uniref:TonB-dependent receptor n=1 Tax=Bacteroides sp. 519 TaxID=2302937 RepID=UPI0013D57F18|nr:TonB-dependent receptor [Bacteroides sp. 519]NDV57131.1 hypothetical protein [Bacteroides sp. 519]